jgi:transposase-like protein
MKGEVVKEKTTIRYSEAFKQQVIEQLASGKFSSVPEASRAYGITGAGTIYSWLKKYGREDLLSRRIRVETMDEINQLKQAKQRIRELEAALADAHIDHCLEHAFLEIACERLNTDLTDFKKKNALTLSSVRRKQGRK